MLPFPIDHIGIVCKDLEQTADTYRKSCGLEISHREELVEAGLSIVFLSGPHPGVADLELIKPNHPDGAISRFIERRGEGLHHICFKVNDIVGEMKKLAASGFQLIDAVPRAGARGGARIAFIHHQSFHGTLVELCEYPA